MAEALEAIQDPFAIFGFSSEGRFRINLYAVKTFQEPYSEQVRFRIGNIEPKKLTRLGAVIRHGIFQLGTVPTAVKLLIIFTDGKPFDLEYGNLNYAMSDTMKAVQEAKKYGIHPFLITSDTDSKGYLDKIIPESRRLILQHPFQLPALMPRIYRRLTL
jgi:nitric oxide reductase NorD protein